MKITALAHPNIALVKYWGKKDPKLNLPAVGSISVTLNKLHTRTTVEFREDFGSDKLILNSTEPDAGQLERVSRFLDLIRHRAKIKDRALVKSENNFPTGAGLASSASAFASLALAASQAAGLNLNARQLSELARLGSGSAARSIFGGYVEMKTGLNQDGSDAVAIQLENEQYWDLRILIALTSEERKKTGSTEGMQHTAKTSPFYGQWIYSSVSDIDEMRSAIFTRNFRKLGEIAEFSCLKMHAVAMSARPGLIYWNATTLAVIEEIRKIREEGLPAYFTIDAGPQVKVICRPENSALLQKRLAEIPGVLKVLETSPGPGVQTEEAGI